MSDRPVTETDAALLATLRTIRGTIATLHNMLCRDCRSLTSVGESCDKHAGDFDALNSIELVVERQAARIARLEAAFQGVESQLINVQPHIANALLVPFNAAVQAIDTHIDLALEILRATLRDSHE